VLGTKEIRPIVEPRMHGQGAQKSIGVSPNPVNPTRDAHYFEGVTTKPDFLPNNVRSLENWLCHVE
jgi:hypothetical protein